jgi:hypothetical protein
MSLRCVEDTLTPNCRAGEEIRSLSRFIGAQRLAFTKLLKKYKKWTRSENLEIRFKSEVLNRPTSFTRISLSSQFDDWADALQVIRAAQNPVASSSPFLRGITSSPALRPVGLVRPSEKSEVVASKLGAAIATGNDVSFDATFIDVPNGDSGSKAVYWIHPEQLIELQVNLLKFFGLYPSKPTLDSSSSQTLSPVVTRRSSLSRGEGQAERDSDFGVIILDQLEDYARRQSSSTVSDSEDSFGRSFAAPAAIARWTSSDEATITFNRGAEIQNSGITRIKKKHLGALLNTDRDFEPWKTSGNTTPVDGQLPLNNRDTLNPGEARNLLKKHCEIKPLVGIFAKRSRFVGLKNSSSAGQWCVLDYQISINKILQEDLVGTDWVANISRDVKSFPYAVLQVRQEGKVTKSIIDFLDESHLVNLTLTQFEALTLTVSQTERVRGFSLASHAIWECWKPKSMSSPFWVRSDPISPSALY